MFQLPADCIESNSDKEVDQFDTEKLFESFRTLRNLCSVDSTVQTALCESASFSHSLVIIDKLIQNYEEIYEFVLNMALQFIFNLSVNNQENKQILQSNYSYFKNWMSLDSNEVARNFVCGIIYNISLNSDFLLETVDVPLLKLVIDSAMKSTEFPKLYIENLFKCNIENFENIMALLFGCRDDSHLFLYKMFYSFAKENEPSEHQINFFSLQYHGRAEFIGMNLYDATKVHEVKILIKILLNISANINTLLVLQQNTNVLDVSCIFLSYLTEEGKNPDSEFALSNDINVEQNEVYNLKTLVIRLIGNLCWRRRMQQDRVRCIGGIPVILSNCIRDMRNPFIVESIVFAIRNICEDNPMNQIATRGFDKENTSVFSPQRTGLYKPNSP